MSNVLIGIIGVILFIGLALAGALFLGPRFQEATNSSKASSAVSMVKQVADAAELYRVQEGQSVSATLGGAIGQNLTDAGYLKSPPRNPSWAPIRVTNNSGNHSGSGTKLYMVLGRTENDRRICELIERQMGNAQAETYVTTPKNWALQTSEVARVGCFIDGGDYQVHSPI